MASFKASALLAVHPCLQRRNMKKLPEKELSKTAPSFPAKKVLYDGLVYVGYEIESTNKCGDRSNTDRFK
eukprot:scaffold5657_cov124-Skeletonema_dohrnii-CCMP3373.AAC.1